jgi:hypothetical protein
MKYLLQKSPAAGLGFLSSVCSFVANWITYLGFVIGLGPHSYSTMKDLGTIGYADVEYIDIPLVGRLITYFRYHTVTIYELKTFIYRRSDGAMVQDVFKIKLQLDFLIVGQLVTAFLPPLSLIWNMQLVLWSKLSHNVIIHSPPPPPPPLPPSDGGGGNTGPKDAMD